MKFCSECGKQISRRQTGFLCSSCYEKEKYGNDEQDLEDEEDQELEDKFERS